MKKLILVYIIVILLGCGKKEAPAPAPAPRASVEGSAKQDKLPKFTLSCTYMGHQKYQFRWVSDGKDIYFGSENGEARTKSDQVEISERKLIFQELEPSGEAPWGRIKTELQRDTLKIIQTSINISREEWHLGYACESIEDPNIINQIKSDFHAKKNNIDEKKREYESRPNKI